MNRVLMISILAFLLACSYRFNPEITTDDLLENISYLASDSLKGRKAGSEGDSLAAEFIRLKLRAAGLQMLCEDGFQPFRLVADARLGEGNELSVGNEYFDVEKDFLPYAFSANTSVKAPVVFAGFGIRVNRDTLTWDDYRNLDVKGKWVMVLQGDPDPENPTSAFLEFASERAKALTAVDNEAAGILLVAGPGFSKKDELSPLFFDKNSSRFVIPVLQITRRVADAILEGTGETVESLETKTLHSNGGLNLEAQVEVSAKVNVQLTEKSTRNVVAMLPGTDPQLKDELVVIGAHFDHLGMGGAGSGSRVPDTLSIHNGADDNASGVAAVIELAEKLAAEKNNRRSVLFISFSAEEMGLIGSKFFTNNSPVDHEKVVAMFNFDMVGRLDTATNALSVGGTKTAKESEEILQRLNTGFQLALSGEGLGPSDHASFYIQNVPVFFFSTGAHPDYHTPNDDTEFINLEGEKKVLDYALKVIEEVVNRDTKLTFQEAGSKFQRSRGDRYKVTLGIMPDFAGVEKRGLRVDAVTKGKPAQKAGMKKGDIITAINGKKVGNIYDYMSRLKELEAGQTISVDVLRNDQHVVLVVQL